MFQVLLIAFLTVPVVEIYLLFQVGEVIGAGWTIFLIIVTAIIGATLLRQQGLATLTRLNQSIAQGQLPPTVMIEGLLLLVSGAFLLTPGFFTDAVGFLLLVPPVRHLIATYLLKKGLFMAAHSQTTYTSHGSHTEYHETHSQGSGSGSGPSVIEGEFERKDDK